MKFFAVAAALIAAVSAGYPTYEEDVCTVVTITTTVTAGHVPSAPGHYGPTAPAPYPTTSSGPYYPSVPASSGTGYPVYPTGTAAPSGTGVYYPPSPPEFTGAASAVKIPAVAAGVVGLAAYFL
ncbi:hypothetical protein CC78DRAFT_286302 [Lojkania enalia]|uniref:Uncharacterized protein n=1 Tax=Lojkania enalia TaxID=147567 RepID=A0A9P4K6S3_9PLEO|nr:hypothetical protein CC78DRAFT_286302 [Didymosphaeria enalia]